MADAKTLAVYAKKIEAYKSLSAEEPSAPRDRARRDFLSALPTGARILDLGCGPGHDAGHFAAQGYPVEAWDASPAMVTEAATHEGVAASCATFDDLRASGVYGGIWASFSLLHAARAALPGHLAAIHQALRPGGVLALGMKIGTGEGRDALGRFYTYVEENELGDMLARAGFRDIEATLGVGKGLAGSIDPFITLTCRA